jgi:hypothetical protein
MLSSPLDVRRTLSGSSARRFVNFSAIYFAKRLPMGFAIFAVPAWLAEAAAPTAMVDQGKGGVDIVQALAAGAASGALFTVLTAAGVLLALLAFWTAKSPAISPLPRKV